MYGHYVKFGKYGKVHRGKEKASIIVHIEINIVDYFKGERDGLISMLKSLFSSLGSVISTLSGSFVI